MSRVEIYRLRWYDPEKLREIVEKIFEKRVGLISKGDRVLLKPNMLAPSRPEKAVTTHPEIVKAVAERIIDLGGKPSIGDSPSLSRAEKVAAVSGIKKVAQELGIPIVELDEPVEFLTDGYFKRIEVSKKILEFDRIINLAKFKTHTQMIMTLAVKNMFGIVPGKRKGEWHLRAPKYMDFARMLFTVYNFRRPDLNIIDGIVAMEGEGPQNGRPFPLGYILASDDGLSLDYVASKMVKADGYVYLIKVAKEDGMLDENIEISGDLQQIPEVSGFELPSTTPISPEFARRILRGALPKPVIIGEKCTECGLCQEACPTNSILKTGKNPKINYSTCISCFVCQEVCPFDSIEIRRGIASRFL